MLSPEFPSPEFPSQKEGNVRSVPGNHGANGGMYGRLD